MGLRRKKLDVYRLSLKQKANNEKGTVLSPGSVAWYDCAKSSHKRNRE